MAIISQDCKDLHRLIIRHMAKKNTYTKLDALGSDQRYSVRFFAASGTGRRVSRHSPRDVRRPRRSRWRSSWGAQTTNVGPGRGQFAMANR